MAEIIVGVLAIIVLLVLSFAFSVLGGTFLYFIWPVTAVTVFGLPTLSWWQAVCFVWTMRLLIPTSSSSSKKD